MGGASNSSKRKSRKPTRDEIDLFAKVTRDAARVETDRHADHAVPEAELDPGAPTPAEPQGKPDTAARPAPPGKRGATQPPKPESGPSALADHRHGAAPGMDRRLQQRLKRGQLPIEARIDLHGLTREKAHVALNGFLARQQALGRRCVLVITGKGRPDWERRSWGGDARESGVIRRALAGWLRDYPNAGRVLGFTPAQPEHGGHGAWYVLLRRDRSRKA